MASVSGVYGWQGGRNPPVRQPECSRAQHAELGRLRRAALALAWWVDGVAHRVIERLDPVPEEQVRQAIMQLREWAGDKKDKGENSK